MNDLVVAEGILGTTSVDTNMAEASSSKPKSKGKGGKKKDFTKQDGKQLALGVDNKGKKKKRTTPKEGVSIMVRKVIGRGSIQNSQLTGIKV